MFSRSSGILLHISSLPSNYGIGSLGKEAYAFADFLKSCRQSLWQILPLCPTGYGDCPYQGLSAFAGNPLLIDIDSLITDGLLKRKDLETISFPQSHVDFSLVITYKTKIFRKAYENFERNKNDSLKDYKDFCHTNKGWLDDFALYMALLVKNDHHPWNKWEKGLRFRDKDSLKKASTELRHEIAYHKFLQFIFFRQWFALKKYVNSKGIRIIGDNPIYLSYASCDVWTHPELFMLDRHRKPLKVSGVPPDYFSPEGQLWGHPLYNWKAHQESDFKWWVNNMKATFNTVDILRIDHFIGFVNYWAIKFGGKNAINGKWQKAPGHKLFQVLKEELGTVPIIAEDLGNKTPEVDKLMRFMNFPGMKLLQEGISGGEDHSFHPRNFDSENFVVYTSTHDSDTVKGWYAHLDTVTKKKVLRSLRCKRKEVVPAMIQQAWASRAVFAIAQMQDVLELGSEARMNVPGTAHGNWQWRMPEDYATSEKIKWLSEITILSRR